MRPPCVNIGQKYGRLTVLEYVGNVKGRRRYKCVCDCGNFHEALGRDLKSGQVKSCGCLGDENRHKCYYIPSSKTHGCSKEKLYQVWCGIRKRCNNKKAQNYKYYGGSSIKICDEWNDYINFKNWAISNGYKDGLTIERNNIFGNYEPSNCRWIPMEEQALNTRRTVEFFFNGEFRTVHQICELTGLNRKTVYQRCRGLEKRLKWEDSYN